MNVEVYYINTVIFYYPMQICVGILFTYSERM